MINWIVTKEELQEAVRKAEKTGKQPFDWLEFISLYTHQHGDCEQLSADGDQFRYMAGYYSHPDIMTVAEYAKYRDETDASGEF